VRSLWREWSAARLRRARAEAYVAAIFAEPSADDVAWLATNGTDGDADHARWELRYARSALGLLTAQRDALDDHTASEVARALGARLGRDPSVAAGKLRVAEQQLNARLTAYGQALAAREGAGTGWHLGRTLLEFAGRREALPPPLVAQAGELLARYLTEANAALRERFGTASLPEDIAPSALRGAGRS